MGRTIHLSRGPFGRRSGHGRAGSARYTRVLCLLAVLAVTVLPFVFAPITLAIEGGQITGTVTSAATKAPIEGVEVCPERLIGGWPPCVKTDSDGGYTLGTVWGGNFRVEFKAPAGSSYIRRTYYGEKYSPTEAAVISVPEGGTAPGIDAELAEGGRISGTVTGASPKTPLEGIKVCAREPEHPRDLNDPEKNSGCTTTDLSGKYTIGGLPSGAYEVEFEVPYSSQLNFFSQFYDGRASWPEANLVSVIAGSGTPEIDAGLQVGGQITGAVTSTVTKAPIVGAEVCAGGENNEEYEHGCATTNANGEYTILRLASGKFLVEFDAPGYVTEYWGGELSSAMAQYSVPVTTGSVTSGIDMALEELPRISGKVTNFSSKAPIKGIEVCVRRVSSTSNGPCATTNTNGEYSIADLEVGEYTVEFSASGLDYLTQYYDGTVFSYDAVRIPMMPGTNAKNIDAELEEPGQISGKVTSAATKTPLEEIYVCAGEPPEGNRTCTTTNAQGEYTISGLPGRAYYVEFDAGLVHYLTQFYANESSRSAAQPVTVTPGNTTSGVDAELVAINGGGLTGTVVSSETERPIEGIEVCAYEADGEGLFGRCAKTESRGEYTITGLSAGEYEVEFSSPANSGLNYVTQYYHGQSSASEATTVTVAAGSLDPSIDARLREGGRITGKAVDASSQQAAVGIEVCAFARQNEDIGCAVTDAAGEYTIAGLAHGEYIVEFSSSTESGLNYVTQYYDGKASFSEATLVPIEEGGTKPGIDAKLEQGGQIAGEVTDASTGASLREVLVCALAKTTQAERCGLTSSSGEYKISTLPVGQYKVGFDDGKNYVIQYYNDKLSFFEAQTVPITAGDTASGIDAAMNSSDAIPPMNTKPPAVLGTPTVGETLRCADGLWTGSPTPSLTDRWLRDGAPIPGASAGSYTAQSADEGHSLSCEVTAKNTAGQESAVSTGVAIPGSSPIMPATTTGPAVSPSTTTTSSGAKGVKSYMIGSMSPITITASTLAVSGGSTRVHIRCGEERCAETVELIVRVVTKLRKGGRTVSRRTELVLARGSISIVGNGKSASVVLRLTPAGSRQLAHADRRHPVAVDLAVLAGAKTIVIGSVLAT